MTLSAASVETLVKHASDALEDAYIEVLAAVDQSPVRGADETSWSQAGQTEWMSVATAQRAALFQMPFSPLAIQRIQRGQRKVHGGRRRAPLHLQEPPEVPDRVIASDRIGERISRPPVAVRRRL